MSEPWMPFFEDYKLARPGAQHNGWNLERVFEAGFVAGMVHWAALTENLEQVTLAVPEIVPDSSAGAVTIRTEWGVQFMDSEGVEEPVWLAEDEYEARAEAMGYDGKMMTRTVGPWEVVK